MKDSFVLYKSHYQAIKYLNTTESKMKVFAAICDYMFEDIEPVTEGFTDMEKVIITMAMPTLNNAKINYENGCKGGAPVGNQNAKKKTTENNPPCFSKTTPKTSNVNVNVKENLNLKENVNVVGDKTTNNNNIFAPPSLQEVQAYCHEEGLLISPEYFYNYYEQRNWEGVKDWKLAALGWNRNQKTPAVQNVPEHKYMKRKGCPDCKSKTIWWNEASQVYSCDTCSKSFTYEAINK